MVTGFDLDQSGNLFYLSDTDGMFRWTDRRMPEKDGIIKESDYMRRRLVVCPFVGMESIWLQHLMMEQ